MLAFFGLGPTELIILAAMGLVPLVVIVVVLMAVRRSSSSGRGDSSQMATCSACGLSISRAAAACPQCGHPNQPQPPIRG